MLKSVPSPPPSRMAPLCVPVTRFSYFWFAVRRESQILESLRFPTIAAATNGVAAVQRQRVHVGLLRGIAWQAQVFAPTAAQHAARSSSRSIRRRFPFERFPGTGMAAGPARHRHENDRLRKPDWVVLPEAADAPFFGRLHFAAGSARRRAVRKKKNN